MRWPRPYRSFKRANERRCELIDKEFSPVEGEEFDVPFAEMPPELKARYDELVAAALTAEERRELERLQELVGDYVDQKSQLPSDNLEAFEKRVDELTARLIAEQS